MKILVIRDNIQLQRYIHSSRRSGGRDPTGKVSESETAHPRDGDATPGRSGAGTSRVRLKPGDRCSQALIKTPQSGERRATSGEPSARPARSYRTLKTDAPHANTAAAALTTYEFSVLCTPQHTLPLGQQSTARRATRACRSRETTRPLRRRPYFPSSHNFCSPRHCSGARRATQNGSHCSPRPRSRSLESRDPVGLFGLSPNRRTPCGRCRVPRQRSYVRAWCRLLTDIPFAFLTTRS
jgi:hypothetical protein